MVQIVSKAYNLRTRQKKEVIYKARTTKNAFFSQYKIFLFLDPMLQHIKRKNSFLLIQEIFITKQKQKKNKKWCCVETCGAKLNEKYFLRSGKKHKTNFSPIISNTTIVDCQFSPNSMTFLIYIQTI